MRYRRTLASGPPVERSYSRAVLALISQRERMLQRQCCKQRELAGKPWRLAMPWCWRCRFRLVDCQCPLTDMTLFFGGEEPADDGTQQPYEEQHG